MTEAVKQYDVVAVVRDVPEEGLRRGQVGTVVELLWAPDRGRAFEVEFSDPETGHTYAQCALKEEDLLVLQYHPQPVP